MNRQAPPADEKPDEATIQVIAAALHQVKESDHLACIHPSHMTDADAHGFDALIVWRHLNDAGLLRRSDTVGQPLGHSEAPNVRSERGER